MIKRKRVKISAVHRIVYRRKWTNSNNRSVKESLRGKVGLQLRDSNKKVVIFLTTSTTIYQILIDYQSISNSLNKIKTKDKFYRPDSEIYNSEHLLYNPKSLLFPTSIPNLQNTWLWVHNGKEYSWMACQIDTIK